MTPKSVLFASFPYGGFERREVSRWITQTALKATGDPRISKIDYFDKDDTPITMSRNLAIEVAKAVKADLLVMLDSDMNPDAYLKGNQNGLGVDPDAVPFWESSLDFMWKHYERGPCMIGSPYCGKPPWENVFAFRWATKQSDHPNVDLRIEQFTREEAANRVGFEEVACLPTGLVLIDMRCFEHPLVKPPYTYYEWKDVREMEKASTEDCTFTRDLNIADIPLYCNWSSWSGHFKWKCVGKPHLLTRDMVAKKYREAALSQRDGHEKLYLLKEPPTYRKPSPTSNGFSLEQKKSELTLMESEKSSRCDLPLGFFQHMTSG